MASPSSPRSIFTVTQEEFNVFHSIDRNLFARMVFTLGRDPAESTRVMGLWLWLEQNGEEFNLVHKMMSLPDALIDALSEEAVMAISCIENDVFPFESEPAVDIPMIQHLSKTAVSLRFFHENRLRIFRGVAKICNDICLRAFRDILQSLEGRRVASRAVAGNGRFLPAHASWWVPAVGFPAPVIGQVGFEGCEVAAQSQVVMNGDLSDFFGRLQLNVGNEGDGQMVPPDERTIFLTFSKGYPISEDEVREYFARRYGNLIESVHMQEVVVEEQPLYARLVVMSESAIDAVLEGKSKAKFAINGKHVWARKYVRKNPRSPGRAPSPPSPSAAEGRAFKLPRHPE